MSHHSKPPSIQRNSLKGFVERGECHMQFMLTNVLIQYFKTTSIATALIPLLTYSIPVVDDSLTSNNENLKKSWLYIDEETYSFRNSEAFHDSSRWRNITKKRSASTTAGLPF